MLPSREILSIIPLWSKYDLKEIKSWIRGFSEWRYWKSIVFIDKGIKLSDDFSFKPIYNLPWLIWKNFSKYIYNLTDIFHLVLFLTGHFELIINL